MSSASIRPSSFDGVVLDLDGVVTDTASVHAAAWAELFDTYLATAAPMTKRFDPDVDYLSLVDGRPRAEGVAAFLSSRSITLPWGSPGDPADAETVRGLGNRKDELFRRRIERDGVRSFPGTAAFVERVRAAGKPMAVVSASRNCRDVLAAAGAATWFDVVVDGVVAEELGLPGKPDPATFLLAADRLGIRPGRLLLVEDAIAGVEAGQRGAFGLVVGVDRHHHAEDLSRAGADIVVADLADLEVSAPDEIDPAWTITLQHPPRSHTDRSDDALCSLSDGHVGVRGVVEDGAATGGWLTLVAGAFGTAADGTVELLPGPSLAQLAVDVGEATSTPMQRRLDLRCGVLVHDCPASGITSSRFVSLRRPGLVVIRAERLGRESWRDEPLCAPEGRDVTSLAAPRTYNSGHLDDGSWWAETISDRARVVSVARQRSGREGGRSWLERLAVFGSGSKDDEISALDHASAVGVDGLLAEQQRAWQERWRDADIEIDGDDVSQRAVRFALFHLLSCAPSGDEAGVGARGLSGLAYAGHVFWDADVFVLPALAATLPDAARSMLEYRFRRLGPARLAAESAGLCGARFPWESADTGHDVTPKEVRDLQGMVVPILTGSYEEHITSDVAWAVHHYLDWTGDTLLDGPGLARDLVVETARYWAARVRVDGSGRGHIDGVMGPDEYHEVVDDNAFTNIVVRWHLRRAAGIVEPAEPEEAARWRRVAASLVDGRDPSTGRHEQFAGFWDLEPLRITEMANVPVAADVLLGAQRVARAQVIKQPDVLMAHHLVPAEMPPGSLAADLDCYLPLTAHGSSLSPAVCASLLARAGRPDEALALFDIAADLDLGDLSGTTGGGLHLAAMGGVWQAVVWGFAGVRPDGAMLRVDPNLPERWRRLQIRVRFRGVPVRIEASREHVLVDTDGPMRAEVHGVLLEGSGRVSLRDGVWRIGP